MAEEINSEIFRMEIPLPGLKLGFLNSYFIKSDEGGCLIDLGPEKESSWKKIKEELDSDLHSIDTILFTHFHMDHIGMFKKFRELSDKDLKVRLSSEETKFMKKYLNEFDTFWSEQVDFANLNGLPNEITRTIENIQPSSREDDVYEEIISLNNPLENGEEIRIGKHSLRPIKTPGHSPGHVCYYDSNNGFLFVGDHLLRSTTPSVVQMRENQNPLDDYFESLKKIKNLEVEQVLPAHGEPYQDHDSRVEELIKHHEERLSEIKSIIGERKLSPYEIAKEVNWDVNFSKWEDFPILQKWLATGETIAHLSFLEKRDDVGKKKINNTNHYSLD